MRALLISREPELLDDLARLAAAAGVELDVVYEPADARPGWRAAPVVLVGRDCAAALAGAALRRRPGVVLVSRDLDDATVWRLAVDIGAEHVAVLPDAQGWLTTCLGEAVEGGVQTAPTIAVIGGRGGAGASTLAAALAVTAVRTGQRATLVDADPYGGGLDLLFGGEHARGLRWPDLANARGRLGGAALCDALPRAGELAVLSWDRGDPFELRPEAMEVVLAAAARGCQLVVTDVGRRFDAVSDVVVSSADLVLVVVPAEVRAAAAAARVVAYLRASASAAVQLIVRGPAPAGLDPAAIATVLELPLAGWLRPEPGRHLAALERGELPAASGRGPLATLCMRLLGEPPFTTGSVGG